MILNFLITLKLLIILYIKLYIILNMKNINEVLSPSGNKESFYAAISSGANAIYLGLDKFSARAYATNFSLDNLKEYVDYAHLRNIKIYVTMNTILYDEELNEAYSTVDKLASIGVDAIIVQDLSLLSYIVNTYKSIEAHASTQMGIDDIYGAKLLKDLNVKRVVFARETNISTLKEVKDKLNIEIETFVHGALCVAYSGNCLMSSMIGDRSGNRGRCAGCCRQVFSLIDNTNNNTTIKQGYLLSMKDLNTSNYIKDMSFIDSYKIEGRMKEPSYVSSVTSIYRKLKDKEDVDISLLNKVFNRTYTKGYLFNEQVNNITNIERPNNYGYLIGEIAKINKNKVWIRLFDELNKGDQIRIENDNVFEEISVPITKMFDPSFNVIYSSNKMVIIYLDKKVKLGAKVYKTKDVKYLETINKELQNKEYKKLPISIEFIAKENKQLFLKVEYNNIKAYASSSNKIEKAISSSTTKENIFNQINKLNDTPYYITNYNIDIEDNLFIPLKEINELRRNAINELNNKRLVNKVILNTNKLDIKPIEYKLKDKPTITFEVNTQEQYNLLKELGYKHIYYKNNIVRRNNEKYIDNITDINEILVGGYGGIEYYKNNKNIDIVSDYSFNVTNYTNVALLSSLGVKRITLSLEINKDHINKLVDNYYLNYNTYPNLELIVYGNITLMHTRYCVLKRLNMCGKCKTNKYSLKDRYTSFPILFNDDCTTRILNSKTLNNIDLLDQIHGVNYFRVIFTNENKEDMLKVIKDIEDKLDNNLNTKSFNNDTDTHGHFIKHIL